MNNPLLITSGPLQEDGRWVGEHTKNLPHLDSSIPTSTKTPAPRMLGEPRMHARPMDEIRSARIPERNYNNNKSVGPLSHTTLLPENALQKVTDVMGSSSTLRGQNVLDPSWLSSIENLLESKRRRLTTTAEAIASADEWDSRLVDDLEPRTIEQMTKWSSLV
jgi:hypothetical protein